MTVPSPSLVSCPSSWASLRQSWTISQPPGTPGVVHEGFVVVGSCRLQGLGHGVVAAILTQPFWGSYPSLDEQLDRELRTSPGFAREDGAAAQSLCSRYCITESRSLWPGWGMSGTSKVGVSPRRVSG